MSRSFAFRRSAGAVPPFSSGALRFRKNVVSLRCLSAVELNLSVRVCRLCVLSRGEAFLLVRVAGAGKPRERAFSK